MEYYRFSQGSALTTPAVQNGPARVIQLSLPAGRSLERHRVWVHLFVFLLKGRTVFEAFEPESRSRTLEPGDMVALEPGVPHRLEAQEDSVLALVLVQPVGTGVDAGQRKE